MQVFGNIMNRISEEGAQNTKPEVGMGLTVYSYSDRHAYTITQVDSDKRIWAVEDIATRTDSNGMSDSQSYDYAPGNGPAVLFTHRKDGKWHEGTTLKGRIARLGIRDKFFDYSF